MLRVSSMAVRRGVFSLAILPLAALAMLATLGSVDEAAAKSKKASGKKDPYAVTERETGPATLAVVSLDDQHVTVYDKDGAILRAPVSSGQTGYETPVGIYSVLQKDADHTSNIYDGASMPNMQRITWSGVALHGGPLPGYPASHGCVRLPYKFAERLFGKTKLGMRVIVARNNIAPVPVSHPLLFKRTPYSGGNGILTNAVAMVGNAMALGAPDEAGDEPADVAEHAAVLREILEAKTAEADAVETKAEPVRAEVKKLKPAMKRATKVLKSAQKSYDWRAKRVADAEKRLSEATSEKYKARWQKRKEQEQAKLAKAKEKLDAVKADAQPKSDAYQEVADKLKALEDERDGLRAVAGEAQRKLAPVSVFISLKTQKLYVRQGFQPVFETPVTIRDPYDPIGTYTFTAVDYGPNGRDMRWNVVSVAGGERGDRYYDDYGYSDYDDYWDRPRRPRRRVKKSSKPTPTDVAAAKAALDRITIPKDVRERISKLVLRGSSLIVSDEAAHKETGKQTDFVVLISGEPQGAIKKRRRRDPYYDDYYGYNDDPYSRRRYRRRDGGGFFGMW